MERKPQQSWSETQLYDWIERNDDFSLYVDVFKINEITTSKFFSLTASKLTSYPFFIPLDIATEMVKQRDGLSSPASVHRMNSSPSIGTPVTAKRNLPPQPAQTNNKTTQQPNPRATTLSQSAQFESMNLVKQENTLHDSQRSLPMKTQHAPPARQRFSSSYGTPNSTSSPQSRTVGSRTTSCSNSFPAASTSNVPTKPIANGTPSPQANTIANAKVNTNLNASPSALKPAQSKTTPSVSPKTKQLQTPAENTPKKRQNSANASSLLTDIMSGQVSGPLVGNSLEKLLDTSNASTTTSQQSQSSLSEGLFAFLSADAPITETQLALLQRESAPISDFVNYSIPEKSKEKKKKVKTEVPMPPRPTRYVLEPRSEIFANIRALTLNHWSSIAFEPKKWPITDSKCVPLLISPDVLSQSYSLETCDTDTPDEPLANDTFVPEINGIENPYGVIMRLLEPDLDYPFYKEFFSDSPHVNYIGRFIDGPIIVSVETSSCGLTRIIVRTKDRDERILANKPVTKSNISDFFPSLAGAKLTKVINGDIISDLVKYETLLQVKHYKFGLLYVGPNQTDENEIYSNLKGSAAYDEFLSFLGDVIPLKGHTGYRAGLNVTNNETGTYSVYTHFRHFEIMFHVATFLPFQEHDKQRVERKRHIGNDVVVIIFKDRNSDTDYFSPKILTSHFNSCFFVISPILGPDKKTKSYRINIANNPGIGPYYPYFPSSTSIFKKDEQFRQFLLLKLVNSERMAMHSGEFVVNAGNTRRMQLTEILKKYEKKK